MAAPTRIAYTDSIVLSVTDPGVTTMNGPIMSVRGMTEHGEISGGPMVDGRNLIAGPEDPTVNYDLDVTTGEGTLWGKTRVDPTDFPDGYWDLEMHGKFVPETFNPDAQFAGARMELTGNGAGSLKGWKVKATVSNLSPGITTGQGYVVKAADKS